MPPDHRNADGTDRTEDRHQRMTWSSNTVDITAVTVGASAMAAISAATALRTDGEGRNGQAECPREGSGERNCSRTKTG